VVFCKFPPPIFNKLLLSSWYVSISYLDASRGIKNLDFCVYNSSAPRLVLTDKYTGARSKDSTVGRVTGTVAVRGERDQNTSPPSMTLWLNDHFELTGM
jgi:hypothetical protein